METLPGEAKFKLFCGLNEGEHEALYKDLVMQRGDVLCSINAPGLMQRTWHTTMSEALLEVYKVAGRTLGASMSLGASDSGTGDGGTIIHTRKRQKSRLVEQAVKSDVAQGYGKIRLDAGFRILEVEVDPANVLNFSVTREAWGSSVFRVSFAGHS